MRLASSGSTALAAAVCTGEHAAIETAGTLQTAAHISSSSSTTMHSYALSFTRFCQAHGSPCPSGQQLATASIVLVCYLDMYFCPCLLPSLLQSSGRPQ